MLYPPPTLAQIEENLRSDNLQVRGQAMHNLLTWAQKDPSIHERALPIFRHAVETEQDPWPLLIAVHGIERIIGLEQSRPIWLELLHRPNAQIVERVVMSLNDPSFVPVLLELLQQRPENSIHAFTINALGRLKDPAALEAIVAHLAIPELRVNAIDSLGVLGDARAIPHLKKYLHDKTPAREEDNHGPMLRMCDIANEAIRSLSKPNPGAAFIPMRSWLPHQNQSPPPIPGPPAGRIRFASLVPIFAAIVEVPWVAAILFSQLVRTGGIAKNQHEVHLLDLLALIPISVGFIVGIGFIIRVGRQIRITEWVFLTIGCIACAICLFCFCWELTH